MGWTDVEDILTDYKADMVCQSIGFVLDEDADVIVLASSIGGQKDVRTAHTPMLIPKCSVVDRLEVVYE